MVKCPKCRTENFENCHSIKCPMRDVSFGEVPKSLIEPITKAKSKK